MKKLVFLHVEKAAGTSYRAELYKSFGKDNVWWKGIDSDRPLDEVESPIMGGHVRIKQYLNSGFKDDETVYMSLIREPISRVVSLYNYHTEKAPAFFEGDVAKKSFHHAVFESEKFRNKIRNAQCIYVAGVGGFHKAMPALNGRNCLIGTVENIEDYNNSFCDCLGLERFSVRKANVGSEGYRSKHQLDPSILHELYDLVRQDVLLYHYVRDSCGGILNTVQDEGWEKLRVILESKESRVFD
ncbi:sulfotransferase family protein [Marinobacter salinexigens]|uniref:Sulfotransferase family protein n=1 Tax=Marinobacter salinexigens TaxID=2919747 RepID=A0A5B0VJM3_9GAMM|nr:sulfotransferase family 2 domain-containing protein [Marinobacter salinexigens]KAA1174684.1 sulfotransferase family protein [Marinobacter salinexigens]